MADSHSVSAESVIGKYGTYIFRDKIGKGGNGEVFFVDIEKKSAELPNASEYVIKILKPMPNKSDTERLKREERFRREVNIVRTKLKYLKGIIPIFDSSFDNEHNDYDYQWYLMPKAEPFNHKSYSIEERLNCMLQVAETISAIHELGLSHRDIKPDNMLIYNGRLCLADFGLIWSDEFDTFITGENEGIGPLAIRPPELEAPVNQDGTMFLKSDVYLFAKSLWIVFTGVRKGFYKRYSRIDDDIYLKSMIKTRHTLEPVHNLIENSTFDEYDRRYSIADCLRLLNIQKAIFDNKISGEELSSYKFLEALQRAQKSVAPDEIVINNPMEMQKMLSIMSANSHVIVSELGKDNMLGMIQEVRHIDDRVYEFAVDNVGEIHSFCRKKYYFEISDIHIKKENKLIANTERFGESAEYDFAMCSRLSFLSFMEAEKIGIDGRFILKFVP